jgi:hypothetical protein
MPLLVAMFLVSVTLLSANALSDPDTGFHLATGKYVVQEGQAPHTDPFSYTSQGALIAHYWLSGVVFYGIESIAGGWGLIWFVALLAGITYGLLLLILKLHKTLTPLAFVILTPFVYLTVALWVVRPQVFSYLFVVLLIYLLERWRITEKITTLCVVPVLFVIWANMHAAVVLGLVIVGLYGLDLLRRIWAEGLREYMWPVVLMVASGVVTIINPNGIQTLLYSSVISASVEQMKILEWQSLLYYIDRARSKVMLGLMVVSLLIILWRTIGRTYTKTGIKNIVQSLRIVPLGMVAGGFILPLMSVRHVGWFPLMAAPFVVSEVVEWMSARNLTVHRIIGASALVIALGVVSVIGGVQHVWGMTSWSVHGLAVGAADFIEQQHPEGPLFNTLETGGYLIWRLWPERQVFIDGRSELYTGEVNQQYQNIIRGTAEWDDLLNDTYHINTIVLSYRQWNSWAHEKVLVDFMKAVEEKLGFVLVYWDDAAVVLVRDIPEHKELIDQFGMKVIAPFKDSTTIPEQEWRQAEQELNNMLQRSKKSYVLEGYATQFLLQQREIKERE